MYKFIRFVLVGGAGLCVNLALTYLLTEYFHFWYFISFIIAAYFAWTGMFFGNSLFTFVGHSKVGYMRQYVVFITGYFGIFFINASLVFIETSLFHFYYLWSIIIAAVITTVITFMFSKNYVYDVE